MLASQVIKTRVSAVTKARVSEEAQRELLTESLWLRRAVDAALARALASGDGLSRRASDGILNETPRHGQRRDAAGAARTRLYVRLRHDDRLILQERAQGRGMPASTYVAALVRAHLRMLAPLPREELAALKRSIAELGALGRNLNQIARVAHQTGHITGPGRDDLRSMLKICEAMRDHIKALVRANVAAWESGHAETDN
jgi:mobilization protein NikA